MNTDQEKWIEKIPLSYRANYVKAISGSKAAAIKAKCLDCVNWQRKEVEDCSITTCPLHPTRPYQHKKSPKTSHLGKEQ
jgi:hypothetical protein